MQKAPGPCPRWPRHCGPRARWANQKQHSTWDRYTHISLTLSQVTQSRTERNKNKELVSPQHRREQAPRAPAREDATQTGRWTCTPRPLESVLVHVCVCVCAWKGWGRGSELLVLRDSAPGLPGSQLWGGYPGLTQRPHGADQLEERSCRSSD